MLLDTGADATLLPKSAVRTLGLAGTGERYQLVAFDGTTNESEAVQAVLLFLNKTFRGRFLQVESEVGVIGRNVLNRVRLLLDGPALKLGRVAADDPGCLTMMEWSPRSRTTHRRSRSPEATPRALEYGKRLAAWKVADGDAEATARRPGTKCGETR